MVWYRLEPQLCKVVTHLAPRPAPGDNWCNIAPPKTDSYPVHIWNQKYPAFKVAVPAHCGTPLPGTSTPPPPQQPSQPIKKYPGESPSSSPVTGPVTGPKDDPCAPAMAERAGSEAKYGFKTGEHLLMPRTGTFFSVRTGADHVGASAEPGYTGKPLETRPARVKQSGGMITVAEPGTGDGFIVFAPDDLNEFCLRGDGVHPEGKWPAKISQNTFLIMSGASTGGGDNVRNLLAWGMPSARTRGKPVSGVYIEHDPDTNIINIQHTDANGVDAAVSGGVTIDGVAVGTGGGLSDLVDDTSPQLGGDLDLNGHVITGLEIGTDVQAYSAETMLGSNNLSEVDDAATARSNIGAGTGDGDLLASNNLSDLASDDTAIKNLIGGATVIGAPALADKTALLDVTGATTGGYITLQGIFDQIINLSAGTPILTSKIAGYLSGGKSFTPQAIYNLINSLTAETAPVYNDKLPLYDASASQTDAVTIANLFGHGKAVVVSYTGSGSSGKTVTLTGINRCHFLVLINTSNSGKVFHYEGVPAGATGTIQYGRFTNGNADNTLSLSAPAAGTAQVLTINNTVTNLNASGQTYRVFAVGTPT